jgi:hypothetical protein
MRRLLVLLVATLFACGGDIDYDAKYAPSFHRQGASVAILGVYKDGRMDAPAWTALGPKLARAFGGGPCDAVYGESLLTADGDLANAIDDVAREAGPTDDLLTRLAPAAEGDADTIAVLTITGAPAKPAPSGTSRPSPGGGAGGAGAGGAPMSLRRGRYGGSPARTSGGHSDRAPDPFEMSLSLFSIREHRSVALVSMRYTGKDEDAAVAGFVERVRTELPNARCKAWRRDVKIDPAQIRAGS